jgi:hypothetical protein
MADSPTAPYPEAQEGRMIVDNERLPDSPDELFECFPKPWIVTEDHESHALNKVGKRALTFLVMIHGMVDEKATTAAMAANNPKALYREFALAAERFIERHPDSGCDCLAEFESDHVKIMMVLFKITCEVDAGIRSESGELIQ